jgi:hypothetical protein
MTSHDNPTIFHITHWKAGSQWIHKILRACVPDIIVDPQVYVAHFLSSAIQKGKVYPTVYVTKEQFDNVQLPENWRRFIIIRDLRDTLISAYFSIKVSHGLTGAEIALWRDQLISLPLDEGLMYLMDEWLPHSARIQESWLTSGNKIILYEDLLQNDMEILENVLFYQCELNISRERLREAIIANRFKSLTGREPGDEKIDAHERKGIEGDWQNYFTDPVKEKFKKRYGNLLVVTGYEKDMNW